MSLENLLRIQPVGVISKKEEGHRNILFNILSWIFFDPLIKVNVKPRL